LLIAYNRTWIVFISALIPLSHSDDHPVRMLALLFNFAKKRVLDSNLCIKLYSGRQPNSLIITRSVGAQKNEPVSAYSPSGRVFCNKLGQNSNPTDQEIP